MSEQADVPNSPAGSGLGAKLLLGVALLGVTLGGAFSVSAPRGDLRAQGLVLERAQADVARVASAPHPIGSEEHARVAAYLAGELAAVGLESKIERQVALRTLRGLHVRAARVQNVLGRLRGTGSGDAILLVGHYDSVPNAPGAGDDGAALGAVLETLRVLRAGPALRNDVIVLFSDAEEVGLLGARAFVEHDAWARDVRLVVNLEARGTRGPSILFETSGASAELMRRVARVPGVLAYSFSEDVYRLMPNDTDFSELRQLGMAGFNFAFIHGAGAYHGAADAPARLDARSLADHARHALALTRAFGDADLRALPRPQRSVYFTLPPFGLVVYPGSLVLVFAGLLLLGTALVLWRGLRLRRLAPGTLALGVFGVLLVVVITTLLALILQMLALLASGAGRRAFGDGGLLLTGLVLFSVGVAALGQAWLIRRRGTLPAAAAAVLAWLALSALTALGSPASSYMWAWPLLFALIGLSALLGDGPRATWTAAVCALPALWLWTPALALVGVALGVGGGFVLAPLSALPALLVMALVAPLAGRQIVQRAALVLVLAGIALVGTASVRTARGLEQPRSASLFYAFDADAQTGVWASPDTRAEAWTAQFLGKAPSRRTLEGYFEFGPQRVLAADAPGVTVPAPTLSVTREQQGGNGHGRRLWLHAQPCCDTSSLMLLLSPGTAVGALSVAGQPVDLGPDKGAVGTLSLEFAGVPREGFDIELELTTGQRLEVAAISRTYGLPSVARERYVPRPAGLLAGSVVSDTTLARRKYVF